jgi:hypothetical protein
LGEQHIVERAVTRLERKAAGPAFYRRLGAREEAVVLLSLQPDALDELAAAPSRALRDAAAAKSSGRRGRRDEVDDLGHADPVCG